MRPTASSVRWFIAQIAIGALTAGSALAQGNRPSAPVTVTNTSSNPVPVIAESPIPVSGSISVTGPIDVTQAGQWSVVTDDAFAPGRNAARFGPVDGTFTNSFVGKELVPPVPAGQRLIVSHLHAIGFSNNSAVALSEGGCFLQLRKGDTYQSFLILELHKSRGALTGTQPAFFPLNAGEGLYVSCGGTAPDGSQPSQGFNVTVGGYFVPAAP